MTNHKAPISILIPSFNGFKLISKCLKAIKKQSIKPAQIIIIDNGSSDNTVEYVKKYYPEIKIIKLKRNYGFARACNEGIKSAEEELIVLLNNDAFPDKNWLKELFSASIKYSNISAFAPVVLSYQDSQKIESAGDEIHKDLRISHRKEGHLYNKNAKYKEIFLIPAVASLYRKNFFKDIGYFDEKFVSYFEDVDISLRGQLLDHKYLVVPKSRVIHMGKQTSNKIEFARGYYEFRNSLLVWIKNLPSSLLFKRSIFLRLMVFYCRLAFSRLKPQQLTLLIRVISYLLMNWSSIKRQRQRVQSRRLISDNYMLKNILKLD